MINNGIIYTNDKCIGCNKCIDNCHATSSNVALSENGENKIYVNPEDCILCAECISACSHDARVFKDDTEVFLDDLKKGESISLLIAPAFMLDYPNEYKSILGYLKHLGIKNIFNVSSGADITTWAYLNYLSERNLKNEGMISQPCPAIVTYIEKYQPSLIPKLMPIHSPLLCSAIYLRKYQGHTEKFAFLSPCIAKKEEINNPNTHNMIQYNVTFSHLMQAIKDKNIRKYSADEIDSSYGLGSIYPMPGGLRENIEYYIGSEAFVYQIEGENLVYPYLDNYAENNNTKYKLPLLIDALNCERGCVFGTGTDFVSSLNNDISYEMHKIRSEKTTTKNTGFIFSKDTPKKRLFELNKNFKDLNLSDFRRNYNNRKINIRNIKDKEIDETFKTLNKFTEEERSIDCRGCGFDTCEEMAKAIALDINFKENCHYYVRDMMKVEHEEAKKQRDLVEQMLKKAEKDKKNQTDFAREVAEDFQTINNFVNSLTKGNTQTASDIENIISEINEISNNTTKLEDNLENVQDSLSNIGQSNDDVADISQQTNLLALNASIEAARAGTVGNGFAVVAEEIRVLSDEVHLTSDTSRENTDQIMRRIQNLYEEINILIDSLTLVNNSTIEISKNADNITINANEIHNVTSNLLEKYKNLNLE